MPTVKIDEVQWNQDWYPRSEYSQQQVDAYRQSLESLPPITINENGLLVDGYHRLLAHKQEGEQEIEAEVENIPDDDVLVESIRRNADHGLQLSMADKRRLAVKLYSNGMNETSSVADLLSVSDRSVMSWTKDIRDAEREEEDRRIWEMWLECKSQEEIADILELDRSTIAKRVVKLRKDAEIHNPDPVQVYNIWRFQSCDDRFGIDHPGRIPGQILQNLLYYYTEPFDVVMDPFAGGGVTIDVGKHMARRYRAYDINPMRPDIEQHDVVADGLPGGQPAPKLVFLDPPYWKQKRGDYSADETNLANMPLDDFHAALADIVRQGLEKADYVALIIGPTQKDWKFEDHAAEMIREVGTPHHRISIPYSSEIHGGNYVKMAKENKQWLYLNRDLLIWHGT